MTEHPFQPFPDQTLREDSGVKVERDPEQAPRCTTHKRPSGREDRKKNLQSETCKGAILQFY